MWKWIIGGAVVLIVVLGTTCYYGLKMLTAGGSSAVVTIGASPDRVFASLANADSLSSWTLAAEMAPSDMHGPLKVGDTLRMQSSTRIRSSQQQMTWLVTEVVPGHILAMQAHDPTGRTVLARRDSLTAAGDSTILVSTFASPMMDSLRAKRGDTTAHGGMLEQAFVSAMRLAANEDLERLKARIEGKPMPGGKSSNPPTVAPPGH